MARLANDRGHLIEVHTGSTQDHARHTVRAAAPAYDVSGDGKPDGQNALESDLIRAKRRIEETVGRVPQFVRAVELERNSAVNDTYRRVNLKHVGVNVDSKDNASPRPSPDQVKHTLRRGTYSVAHAIQSGAPHLIVLFHDVNDTTAAHVRDYLRTIADAARAAGRRPRFVTSRPDALAILAAAGS